MELYILNLECLTLLILLWFVTNKKGKKVFKNLTYFQIDKSFINFMKLAASAVF